MSLRTTVALVAAAGLASPALGFAPAALPSLAAHRRGLRQSAVGPRMGLFDSILGGGKKEADKNVVVFKEWSQKGVVDGPKGAGLQGDVSCLFKIGDVEKPTTAFAGQPLSDVATQANAFIPYKCKKGECGTCDVLINGKWVHACQTTIPSMSAGEVFQVNIREGKVESKKSSGFFSAQSFVDGFTNNALGVVGFVNEGIKEEDNFNVRMQREKELLAKVAAKKAAKEAASKQ